MAFYEVDLIDQDGGIASVAAAEVNFWNADSSQAAAWADQYGFTLQVLPNPPAPGRAERNLYAWGDFQQWLASQNSANGMDTSASSSTGAGGLLIAGALIAGVAAFGVVWLVSAGRA